MKKTNNMNYFLSAMVITLCGYLIYNHFKTSGSDDPPPPAGGGSSDDPPPPAGGGSSVDNNTYYNSMYANYNDFVDGKPPNKCKPGDVLLTNEIDITRDNSLQICGVKTADKNNAISHLTIANDTCPAGYAPAYWNEIRGVVQSSKSKADLNHARGGGNSRFCYTTPNMSKQQNLPYITAAADIRVEYQQINDSLSCADGRQNIMTGEKGPDTKWNYYLHDTPDSFNWCAN